MRITQQPVRPNVELFMRRTKLWVDLNLVKIVCWGRRPTYQLSQTKNQPVINFLPNISYKFLICQFSSSDVKIDVCPRDDLQTFYPSEATRFEMDTTCWTIKLIQTKLTEPDVELSMNLTH